MDSNPFRTARGYLNYAPLAKAAALLASAAAAMCLPLLLPILYLFADLIVWQGHAPSYGSQSPAIQKAFRDEWDAKLSQQPDVTDALNKIRPPSAAGTGPFEWEARWVATNYAALANHVGTEAADTYIPLSNAEAKWVAPSQQRLGVLATVVRERTSWTSGLLGLFAKVNTWAWRPAPGRRTSPGCSCSRS